MEGETLKNHVGQVGLVPTTWSKLRLQDWVLRSTGDELAPQSWSSTELEQGVPVSRDNVRNGLRAGFLAG